MHLIKTWIGDDYVSAFLNKWAPQSVQNLNRISGGEFSQAYSFIVKGIGLVVRFNILGDKGFQKDRYCHDNFACFNIPIPKIIETGKTGEYYYAISELAVGQSLNKLTFTQNRKLLPELFTDLTRIHQIPVMGPGYAEWDVISFNGKYPDAGTWLRSNIKPDYWAELAKSEPYFDADLLNRLAEQMLSLEKSIPGERYLIHGDYGFTNTLSDGKHITGIIDWSESSYGDFIYDLAWLQSWSYDIDYLQEYLKFDSGLNLEHYQERCRLYLLLIAFTTLEYYAEAHREKEYRDCLNTITKYDLDQLFLKS